MEMVRIPTSLAPNRSLIVLFAVLLGLAAISAGRLVLGGSLQPATPFSAPAENPISPFEKTAPIAPAVEATSAPMPGTEDSGVRTVQTAAPAPASVRPITPAAAPVAPAAATAAPHPTVPVGPATSAAPSRDIHAIAPEPGMPGFEPPPGRE